MEEVLHEDEAHHSEEQHPVEEEALLVVPAALLEVEVVEVSPVDEVLLEAVDSEAEVVVEEQLSRCCPDCVCIFQHGTWRWVGRWRQKKLGCLEGLQASVFVY